MSVIDHPVHEKVKISADTPYGCDGAKRKPGYWVQQRKYLPDGSFVMNYQYVEDVMSRLCRYMNRSTDQRCNQCKRKSDSNYFKEMGV